MVVGVERFAWLTNNRTFPHNLSVSLLHVGWVCLPLVITLTCSAPAMKVRNGTERHGTARKWEIADCQKASSTQIKNYCFCPTLSATRKIAFFVISSIRQSYNLLLNRDCMLKSKGQTTGYLGGSSEWGKTIQHVWGQYFCDARVFAFITFITMAHYDVVRPVVTNSNARSLSLYHQHTVLLIRRNSRCAWQEFEPQLIPWYVPELHSQGSRVPFRPNWEVKTLVVVLENAVPTGVAGRQAGYIAPIVEEVLFLFGRMHTTRSFCVIRLLYNHKRYTKNVYQKIKDYQ